MIKTKTTTYILPLVNHQFFFQLFQVLPLRTFSNAYLLENNPTSLVLVFKIDTDTLTKMEKISEIFEVYYDLNAETAISYTDGNEKFILIEIPIEKEYLNSFEIIKGSKYNSLEPTVKNRIIHLNELCINTCENDNQALINNLYSDKRHLNLFKNAFDTDVDIQEIESLFDPDIEYIPETIYNFRTTLRDLYSYFSELDKEKNADYDTFMM